MKYVEETRTISVRVPLPIYEIIKAYCRMNGLSISDFLAECIDRSHFIMILEGYLKSRERKRFTS